MWCGETMASVHVHHINHDHTDSRVSNLTLICGPCHRVHHQENGCAMTGKYADGPTPKPTALFAGRLKYLRRSKGWSVREGANHLGISSSSLQRYEKGIVTPTLGVMTRMAQALGVTLDRLSGAPT